MPESYSKALKRARRLHHQKRDVVKAKGTRSNYYISPFGLKHQAARRLYASLRHAGRSKASAARIAHYQDERMK